MTFDLRPLTVTLIDRELPLAAIHVPAGFPSPAADDLEDTVDPFKWVIRRQRHRRHNFFGCKGTRIDGWTQGN